MRALLPLALAALAACSASPPVVPPSPAEQACQSQIDSDPAVREARAISAGNLDWQWQHGPEIAQLKRDAVTRCLRARGLAPQGGVERPR